VDEIRTQQMLSLAESGDLQVTPEPLDSVQVLERIIRHTGNFSCANGKTIRLAENAEAFSFCADPALLRRVLINLIKNALEAVKEGETVTVGCHRRDAQACFTVHDVPVIPPEVQRQLFMRSFSTKGKDRGLGTYSIKLITEKYLKGRVSFVSEAPQGTVFTVCCPLTPP
jgi:signal transduction histidine kinase